MAVVVDVLNDKDEIKGTAYFRLGTLVSTGVLVGIEKAYAVFDGKQVTPADGDKFLRGILYMFCTPYLRAVVRGDYIPMTTQ